MIEEFSLGDKDLINDVMSLPIIGEAERSLIDLYSQLTSNITRSIGIPLAFTTSTSVNTDIYSTTSVSYTVGWDSDAPNSDTTTAWTYSVGSDSYDDPEPKLISHIKIPKRFGSKEELFVWIVDLLRSCSFQGCLTARKMVRNTLNLVRNQIKEYFDKPRLECNNQNNPDPRILILDFYFNEKDVPIRRCFRFIFSGEKKEVEVFER